MEGVMYIVAWIHRRNDDKSVDIYMRISEKTQPYSVVAMIVQYYYDQQYQKIFFF
jgi:hypothetical protein